MSTPPTPLLRVEDLTVRFDRARPVVRDVSFELGATSRVALVGESGSGKSLTALAVLGLLPPSARVSGSIAFAGRELLGLDDSQLARIRGDRLAMVFQEPLTALDPTMRVGRQLAEVIRLHRLTTHSAPTRQRVLEMLRAVELVDAEQIAVRYPHQLSGGQRQRVVLAMALVNAPDLVLCDEPTTALDVTVQAKVLALLDVALRQNAAACLFISHDLAVVAQVCTDVLVMLDGEIVDRGPVAQVLRHPQHPYTAGLVATARLDDLPPGDRLPTLADFYPPTHASTHPSNESP